jgi:hypothetical protein
MADYSNQPYQIPPVKPNSNMALISLIFGILGWTALFGVGSIIAIITGHMAKNEIKGSMGRLGGDGMATAGLVLGYSNIVIGICFICFFFVLPMLGLLTIPFLEGGY